MLFNVVYGKLLHKLPPGGLGMRVKVFLRNPNTPGKEEEDGRKFICLTLHGPALLAEGQQPMASVLTGTRDFSASFLNKAEFNLTVSLFSACFFC